MLSGTFIKVRRSVLQALTYRPTLPLFVFVSYFVLNLRFPGPVYMSDEIGYLDKAATVAGSVVHASTSWFGGYSILISPAFILSSDPSIEWRIVLALNALMWAGSAMLLRYVLHHTHPKASPLTLNLVVLGSMLYPSWISMSGYSFSTSGFVLMFMASLACLIKSKLRETGWLALAGLFAGYLLWIHPLGFIYLGLYILLLMFLAIHKKSWSMSAIAVGALLTGASYIVVIKPLFKRVMSGSITNDSHYSHALGSTLRSIGTFHYWLQSAEMLVGLLFFVVVATYGIAAYGSMSILRKLSLTRQFLKKIALDPPLTVMLLAWLSVVLVICATALLSGADRKPRIDQWVYGRYTDMYLLPLIAFGLLSVWRRAYLVISAIFVLIAGIFLSLITNAHNTSTVFDNKANIQGLWPMHVASIVHANYYWLWGLLGSLAIAIVGFLVVRRGKRFLTLLLIPIALAIAGNYLYHQTIIQHHTVSSLYGYLTTNYSKDDCTGFTTGADPEGRFSLYSYYLHGYDFKKIPLKQWLRDDCKGPYLTYTPDLAQIPGGKVIGREPTTGLYVISRSNPHSDAISQVMSFN